jgi:fatty-acyl-CoA synthase
LERKRRSPLRTLTAMFTRHFAHWPPGKPRTLEIPRETVVNNLEAVAASAPESAAIDYYGSRITYAALKAEVEALAGFLQQRCGVCKGDRVLLYLQNSPQFIIAYYAILRADAVVVPVNPMNRTEELRHYVADSDAAVAIAGHDVVAQLRPVEGLRHILVAVYSDYLTQASDLPIPDFVRASHEDDSWKRAMQARLAPGPHLAGPEDLAVMPYTSGTTGKPKGCMHTHSSLQATTVPYLQWRGADDESVVLAALPMFHVTGMQTGMNAPIYLGATIVILSRWDRDCAGQQIQRAKVTNWSAITTMMVDFLSNPRLKEYDLSSLKVLGGGGAAMPEALAKKLEDEIGLAFVEGYGLSETMAPTHINPPHRPKRQCGGIPFFNTDARILDVDTKKELGVGQIGEIVVRGPQVFRGYWKQPEATAQAFLEHDGERFFRTGDLGYYDEEGYFFITDRLKRMINAAGFKVWPAEVEAMLYAHPAIQEACVVGARDAYRGETVKAFIVLRKEKRQTTSNDIIAWAREKMAAFKVPRLIEFVDALPKTATGKILWRELQERENRK